MDFLLVRVSHGPSSQFLGLKAINSAADCVLHGDGSTQAQVYGCRTCCVHVSAYFYILTWRSTSLPNMCMSSMS